MGRLSFGFHNPNHAAALVCALLPLCFGWRRAAWVGRGLAVGLFAALLLTQSRTGLIVAALEWAAWWAMRKGSRMGVGVLRVGFSSPSLAWLGKWTVAALAVGLSFWWLGPRLALDGSILNRPKIWLAGLRLFAANPDSVGLGNSGALASAFLLPNDVPEVRTLISSHLTLLAECGWLVGWAYLAFLALALCGVRRSPRVGLAFAGLVLSACSASVFDWLVLFDFAAQGGLGGTNWILSWLTFALFVAFGMWLIVKSAALVGRYGDVTTDSHGLARIEGKRPTALTGRPAALNTEGAEVGRHGGEQKVVATAVQETGEASPLISPSLSNSAISVLSESNAPVACAAQISIRENPCQSVDKAIDKIATTRPSNPVNPVRKTPCLRFSVTSVLNAVGMPVLFAGVLVFAARCVPPRDAPRVQGGYAAVGAAPRALALYDGSWSLRAVRARVGADALLPVRPVARFPRGLDFSSVRRVLLFGDCREWAHLVPKGIPVTCAED